MTENYSSDAPEKAAIHASNEWRSPGSRAVEGGGGQGQMVEADVLPAAFVIDGNEAAAEVKAAGVPADGGIVMPDFAILVFEDGVGLGPRLSGVLAAALSDDGAMCES